MTEKSTYEELEKRIKGLEQADFERKQAEKALSKSEEKFRFLAENMADIVWMVDLNFRTTYVSPSINQVLGFTPEERKRQTLEEMVTPESMESLENLFIREFNREKTGETDPERCITNEAEYYHKDGSTVWLENTMKWIRDSKGNIVGVHGVSRDISERKQAEKTLREERDTAQQYLELAGVIFVAINKKGEVTLINQKGCEILGYNEKEIVGKKWFDNFIPKWLRDDLIPVSKKLLNGDIETAEFHENPILTKNGEERIIAWHNTILKDDKGNIIGHLSSGEDITERKFGEKALQESEAAQRTLIESLSAGVIIVDPVTRIIERVNSSTELLFGASKEHIEGNRCHKFLCPASEGACPICDLGQEVDNSEKEIICADGTRLQVLKSVKRIQIRGQDKLLECFVDITERKLAEKALKLERAELLSIFDSIDEIIYITDPHTYEILYVNQAVRSAFQKDPVGGICYREFQGLEAPCDFCTNEIILEDKENSYQWEYHNPILAQDYLITDKIIKWPDGRDVRFEIALNITDRKQTEEALRKSEEKLRAILETSPDPIAVYDNNGYPQYLNPAFTALFGWTLDELKNDIIPFVPEDQKEMTQDKIKEIYESGTTGKIETKRLTKESKIIDVIVNAAPIKGVDETPSGLVVCLTDMSRIKKLQDQLRQAHKMEAIGTLAGGIAHEFNNILGIIVGNTELAIDDVPEWNPAKDCLEEIRSASLRAKDVVRQILSFARKTPLDRKPIQVSAVITESLKLLRAAIPTNIRIEQKILCESEMILANPTEINQILINLCTNSVLAMEDDTGVLDVRLEAVHLDDSTIPYEELKPGDHVKLTIEDTGRGIAPEIMDRIFDPYFTTKDVDIGLGMGLAIVYGIIKKHDGAITIESVVGKGTTATVLLPIIETEAEVEKAEPEHLSTGSERILFVDDEASLVKMAIQMLERLGYQVVGKTDSIEALEQFRAEPNQFDLVITDMAMPHMAGDRLAQELRKVRSDIPIILCTGHSARIDEPKAKDLGIDAYTMKPLYKNQFTRTVRKVLDEAKGKTQE